VPICAPTVPTVSSESALYIHRSFEIDLPTLSEARTKVFNASSMNELVEGPAERACWA